MSQIMKNLKNQTIQTSSSKTKSHIRVLSKSHGHVMNWAELWHSPSLQPLTNSITFKHQDQTTEAHTISSYVLDEGTRDLASPGGWWSRHPNSKALGTKGQLSPSSDSGGRSREAGSQDHPQCVTALTHTAGWKFPGRHVGHLLRIIKTESCKDKTLQSILGILAHGWNNINFRSGAQMGNPIRVWVTPSIFLFALENLHLLSPDTSRSDYGRSLRAERLTPEPMLPRETLSIWNTFGHQRAIIICDPENMHQRQFTGSFKEKPKKTESTM